jgi:hypothetical protein
MSAAALGGLVEDLVRADVLDVRERQQQLLSALTIESSV